MAEDKPAKGNETASATDLLYEDPDVYAREHARDGGPIYGVPMPPRAEDDTADREEKEPAKSAIIFVDSRTFTIPELCIVVLIGPAGSGKSTFARKHFLPTEILSSDSFREMIADSEHDQTTNKDAFEVLFSVAEKRLRRGKLTVVDATNVQSFALEPIVRMARDHFVRVVAFVFDLNFAACLENNAKRERQVEERIVRRHIGQLRQVLRGIRRYKGIRNVWTFRSNGEAEAAKIERIRSRHFKHFDDNGPFDIIGDVHGCFDELCELLKSLGYRPDPEKWFDFRHPEGRKAVFVGDYVDRGPSANTVLTIVRTMQRIGSAYCLPGNHDVRLERKLRKGTPEELLKNSSKLTHGLRITLEDLYRVWSVSATALLAEDLRAQASNRQPESRRPAARPSTWSEEQRQDLVEWIRSLPSHLILDHGKLVVSHAGLREEMIGRSHGAVREFCLYGNPTGAVDDGGFPVREDWAKDYRGKAIIAYGHIHAGAAEFRNNTICLDTNVALGGSLTALRYPERDIVSVSAKKTYFIQEAAPTPIPATTPTMPTKVEVLWVKNAMAAHPISLLASEMITHQNRKQTFDGGFRVTIEQKDGMVPPPSSNGAVASTIYKREDGKEVVDVKFDGPVVAIEVDRIRIPIGKDAEGKLISLSSPGAGVSPAPELVETEVRLSPNGMECVARELEKQRQPTPAMNQLFDVKDDLVDIANLIEKRVVDTRLIGPVRFTREMAAAALEQVSRFSVDPRWLIYLPPTMSPCEAAPEGNLLERPEEAFAYYRDRNVPWVVCEEKHMGSRLIAVACRDEKAAFERFGVRSSVGACYTRLGRPFFLKPELEKGLLDGIRTAMDRSELWEKLKTDWICLDCELMPWSAKAGGLLHRQYAGTGRAGRMALRAEVDALVYATGRGSTVGRVDAPLQETDEQKLKEMAGRWLAREDAMEQYVEAYRRYCWPTDGMKGLKLAPFHVMATEGCVHADKSHLWHLSIGTALAEAGTDLFVQTNARFVALSDSFPPAGIGVRPTPSNEAIEWWHKMTTRQIESVEVADVEGMVVKPLDFTPPVDERYFRIQPALKCRGREYLRIIYGPEYTTQLENLRKRGLGSKRRLATQEFALGIEGLERFVKRQPLARIHECAFAVLALECEPLDPRL